MADEKDKVAFDELKNRMEGDMESELYEDDNVFYRFLRAQDFKVDKAEAMLREHLEWRKKYDVKNISKFKSEVLQKYLPIPMLGQDKEGHVVRYCPSGNIDFKGLLASCPLEDWKKHLIGIFEEDLIELKRESEKLGKLVDKVVCIHNMENFSLATLINWKVFFRCQEIDNMYQNNYPDVLHSIYVIHAPSYMTLVLSILKAVVPSKVFEIVKVYSDDSWKEDFLKIIDADVLPAFLGGKRTDPDGNPLCETFINSAGLVPEMYYKKQSFANLPEVQKITVSRAAVHEICLEVKEPDSNVEWEFDVKSRDIKFGLLYQNEEKKKTEVIPLQRISTEECTESGMYKCENVGKYIIIFDNTYSVLRSKDILYKIQITTPKEEARQSAN